MKHAKNVKRIDHVVITVLPHNFTAAIAKFSEVLGITFEGPIQREDAGVQAAISWESGMEIIAPLKAEGRFYERVVERGEGHMTVVFGVDNFDDACKHAAAAGVLPGAEIGLLGDEPWANRFTVLRESSLAPMFGATVVLGEIEPKN